MNKTCELSQLNYQIAACIEYSSHINISIISIIFLYLVAVVYSFTCVFSSSFSLLFICSRMDYNYTLKPSSVRYIVFSLLVCSIYSVSIKRQFIPFLPTIAIQFDFALEAMRWRWWRKINVCKHFCFLFETLSSSSHKIIQRSWSWSSFVVIYLREYQCFYLNWILLIIRFLLTAFMQCINLYVLIYISFIYNLLNLYARWDAHDLWTWWMA